MVVSLPMYVVNPAAVEAFWRGLRHHMRDAGLAGTPDELHWPKDLYGDWRSPDLLLSQTCGYPFVTSLAREVRYVGTPRYTAAGCDGPFYSSAVIVRADDPASTIADCQGRRAAFNSRDSQSGHSAFRDLVAPYAKHGRFFGATVETGGHRLSVRAVRVGDADLAAVDGVTLALLAREAPDEIANLRILCFSAQAPGLPLITAKTTSDQDVDRLRHAFAAACGDPALQNARSALLLDGFDVLSPKAYNAIPMMRDEAASLGYSELA